MIKMVVEVVMVVMVMLSELCLCTACDRAGTVEALQRAKNVDAVARLNACLRRSIPSRYGARLLVVEGKPSIPSRSDHSQFYAMQS